MWTVFTSGIGGIMCDGIHHINRLKKKKISSHLNRYRTCIWWNQHPFMIITQQTRSKREILQLHVWHLLKNLQWAYFTGERLNCFPPKIGNKARMSCLLTSIKYYTRSPSQCIKTTTGKREKKCKQIGKKE